MSNQNKATEEAGKIGHTPGPWRAVANESYWEVRASEDFGSVADTCSSSASAPHYGRSWALGEANAHLIASSPDLYEACKQLLNLAHWAGIIESEAIDAGKAAISKAEGKV